MNKIIRVKRLSHQSKAWIMDPQEDEKLYLDDPISRIAGFGKEIEKSLKDNNIMNVADLLDGAVVEGHNPEPFPVTNPQIQREVAPHFCTPM